MQTAIERAIQSAIERAIKAMWDRYNEPLTLGELADAAIFSRFYFSRVFRAVTGTSPVRFLTAVRLFKAKNLLLETSLSVTDISYEVGYNSLGTFTTRFTRSVGMSPKDYRYLSQVGIPPVHDGGSMDGSHAGSIYGLVRLPKTTTPTRVYVAAFDGPIPQGRPAACDIVDCVGSHHLRGGPASEWSGVLRALPSGEWFYHLRSVPPGEWFLHATAVALDHVDPRPWHRRPLFVNSGEVDVPNGGSVEAHLDLHPTRATDIPVLFALPELDSQELPKTTTQIREPAQVH